MGVYATSQAVVETDAQSGSVKTESASDLGIGIGATLSLGTFLCTGLPFFLFFGFLFWRNGVAMRDSKRHQETLSVLQGDLGKVKRE